MKEQAQAIRFGQTSCTEETKTITYGSWYDKKKNVVVPKVGIYKLFDTKDKKDGFTIDESQWNKFLDRKIDMNNIFTQNEPLKCNTSETPEGR